MTNLLKTFTLAGFSCLALGIGSVQAQNATQNKMGEFDEIVIKHKSDKDGKVTIEIKDGEVLIDGKKPDQYSSPDISVFRRSITPVNGNNFSFENGDDRGGFDLFNDDNAIPMPGNKAVLGVITEKVAAKGTTVKTVAKGTPADKAGILAGDIITKIDDSTVNEPEELYKKIGEYKPGDKVTVTYIRNKKEGKVSLTLSERKNEGGTGMRMLPAPGSRNDFFRFSPMPRDRQGFGRGWFDNADQDAKLGIQVQDTENGEGAQIINMQPSSIAEKAGFKVDDLITEMAGAPVKSAHDVAKAFRENRSKGTIMATVKRNGKEQTLQITVPKKLNKADL
ncbi:PDZ domain-containing protein [Chitinophaga sp. MM2321]|uniref:PDZ domain-containing protein n=1 Tax=Chitinophaga sp. MM2321 TaxID=3137178 RepID=UPI0032D56F6E